MAWTLADIRTKVRATTGRPDTSMMSDSMLDDYINKYYQYVLTKELKIFWGYTYYQFFTEPNVDQYAGPTDSFQTINPAAWCDGFPIEWYISPDLFWQDYPEQKNKQVIGVGDASTGQSFSFNISAYPVLAGSVYVTDGTTTAQDDGNGGFIAPATGTIDYVTGTVSNLVLDPTLVIPVDTNVTCTSQTYQPNRPQAIMYFKSGPLANSTAAERDDQNYFVLRPVPDNVYLIKMQGIQIPPALSNATDVPFREDLGPLIAYGASLEIFADFNQMDQYDQIMVQYNRYKDVSMQDTYEEYLYQRSVPTF
jgi:hypothetical protein